MTQAVNGLVDDLWRVIAAIPPLGVGEGRCEPKVPKRSRECGTSGSKRKPSEGSSIGAPR